MKQSNLRDALSGLEPFKKEKQLKVKTSDDLEKTVALLMQNFEDLRIWEKKEWNGHPDEFLSKLMDWLPHITITPSIIEEFALRSKAYEKILEESSMSSSPGPGMYLTALIQKSYGQNHNGFTLPIGHVDGTWFWLAAQLKGKTENKIRITIKGDAGHTCAYWAEGIDLRVEGQVGISCGQGVRDSVLYVSGSEQQGYGFGSRNSEITLIGKASKKFCYISSSSIIRSTQKTALARLRNGGHTKKCKLFWINHNGEEKLFAET